MSKIRIEIITDNAAFEDDPWGQIANILEDLAHGFRSEDQQSGYLWDVNGNKCGWVGIDDDCTKFEPAQEHYE